MGIINQLKKFNQYAFISNEENNPYLVNDYLDTGIYSLNAILSGDILKGIPMGKRISFYGEASTAKSLLVLQCAKTFLENDEEREVIVFETEGATILDMLDSLKLDKKKIGIVPVNTAEELKILINQLLKKIKEENKFGKYMFILDSLGMLASEKEVGDAESGKSTRDMTRAQIIRSLFRTITLDLAMLQIPFLIVSHQYQDIGGNPYASPIISGGGGIQFASDVILHLSKAKEKEGTKRVGSLISVKVIKSRFVKEDKKIKLLLLYGKGFYPYSYLLDYGLELGIIKKEGMSYVFPDGKKAARKKINQQPAQFFTKANLEKLNEAIQNDLLVTQSNTDLDFSDIDDEIVENEEG